MAANNSAVLGGNHGLLRGQRTRSYGSLVSSSSPIRQRRIQHKVQPGETLQGLSLKYGVSMEQIKRANRLYTNDSIFLKDSLFIPVLTESVSFTNGVELTCPTQTSEDALESKTESYICEANADLSPVEYLKKIDGLISQSKQAAAKTWQEGEGQFSSMEQLQQHNLKCSTASSQQAKLGSVPVTKWSKNLGEREDEIFQL